MNDSGQFGGRVLAVAAAAVLLGAGGWIVRSALGSEPGAKAAPAGATTSAARLASPSRERSGPGAPASAAQPVAPEASLSKRVDRLSRSNDPHDAYAAYRLVRQCIEARGRALQGASDAASSVAAACADLASDQIQARLVWLDRAARAGVRHAAEDYGTEGPQGLLVPGEAQRDSSEWQSRMAAYYDVGALNCDLASILSVVARYRLGHYAADPSAALTTWAAAQECNAQHKGFADLPDPRDATVVPALSALLGPAQAAAAIAAGKADADRAPLFGAP